MIITNLRLSELLEKLMNFLIEFKNIYNDIMHTSTSNDHVQDYPNVKK
jgi:hypothetical protein